jgi:preprotein translocase subunit SecG
MYLALIIVILLVCVLLALVVLAQNPKGGGLSSQFGAGGAANLMGVKRTGDLLERLTWGFAIGLMVLTLGTHVLNGTSNAGPARSVNQQKALETRLPSTPAPGAVPPGLLPPLLGARQLPRRPRPKPPLRRLRRPSKALHSPIFNGGFLSQGAAVFCCAQGRWCGGLRLTAGGRP